MPDKSKIIKWLCSAFSANEQIVEHRIFGSFSLGARYIGDVDVIIIFSEWDQRGFLKRLQDSFFDEFNIKLHVQAFHFEQKREIGAFLSEVARRKNGARFTLYDSEIR
jgi:hypothetical protein